MGKGGERMISQRECDMIAMSFVRAIKTDEELLERICKIMSKGMKKAKRLVPAKKAAEMLGISVWQLYRIKDDKDGRPQFSYTKGGSQSSPIKFNAVTLIDEYERYLAHKRAVELGRISIVD